MTPAAKIRGRWPCAVAAVVIVALLVPILAIERGRAAEARRARCGKQLKAIGQAILLYSNENRNRMPDSFATLARAMHVPPSFFVSPDDRAALPAAEAAHFDPADPRQCSFVLIGDTKRPLDSSLTVEAVVAYERPEVHGNDGVHVLFGAGQVHFVPFVPAGKRPAWWAEFEASIARGDRQLMLPRAAPWP